MLAPETTRFPHDRRYSQGGLGDARGPKRKQQRDGELRRSDRLLVAGEEPALGAHLVTPRRGFIHHGIYVGCGKVVHYNSLVRRLCRNSVEEVSLARFAMGRAIAVRAHAAPRFDGDEVMRRARSRMGEARYRVLSNNCEHFCEWCLHDEQRSYQVERLLSLPRRLASLCGSAFSWLRPNGDGADNWPSRVLHALPPERST